MSAELECAYWQYYRYYQEFVEHQFTPKALAYGLNRTDKSEIKSELLVRFFKVVKNNFDHNKQVEYPKTYSMKVLNNALRDIFAEEFKYRKRCFAYYKETCGKMLNNLDRYAHFDICLNEVVQIIAEANLTDKEHIVFASHRTGMSYHKIATELNISIDAVKKRYHRAKAKIYDVLNE